MKQVLKQLDERNDNLRIIDVRIAEYVVSTEVSLQLIKERKTTEEEIGKLRREMDAFLIKTGMTEDELREKKNSLAILPIWLLAVGGLALVFVGVLVVLWVSDGEPVAPVTTPVAEQATPMPLAESYLATPPTPTVSPAPERPPIEATVAAIVAAGLPDVAPSLATTVTLLALPVCADEMNAIADFLTDSVKGYEPLVTVLVQDVPENLREEREAVRALGTEQGGDLLVWCTVDGDSSVFHLETLTQRAAPEVYEPLTVDIPLQPMDRLYRAVVGVTVYLRRDYIAAESVLRTAMGLSSEDDVRAMLMLLIGNAQTMRHDYLQGKDTMNEVVALQPDWVFAWHNLGVTEFNSAWGDQDFDRALAAFEKARTIDPGFDLSLISIAQIHRRLLHGELDRYTKAFDACEAASHSNNASVRAQSETCRVWNQVFGHNLGLTQTLPLVDDPVLFSEMATAYWGEPLAVLGRVEQGYWKTHRDPASLNRMYDYYIRYVIAAADDVLLAESSSRYQDIIRRDLPER